MRRNLILSGGVAHDYGRTSALLADILSDVGVRSEIHDDFQLVEDRALLEYDMLTLNCARWTCSQAQVSPEWRERARLELSDTARQGLTAFLGKGKGLLALHCATICFDDWPEYRKILGACWEWGYSGHAPLQKHLIRVHRNTHAVTTGIEDFTIHDELYTRPRITDSLSPLAEGEWEGERHPVLWLREYGTSRICYSALGHGPEAFDHPTYRILLQRGALWVLKRLSAGCPSSSG